MPEKKRRFWRLEGDVPHRFIVRAEGHTLEEAVARAEAGDHEVEEELKPTFPGFTWASETDVEVSEDGEQFEPW